MKKGFKGRKCHAILRYAEANKCIWMNAFAASLSPR